MTAADTLRLAVQSLRLAPLRSCLTILGLSIGVGAILTVLTLGNAGQIQVEAEICRLGVDKLWITSAQANHSLSKEDAQSIHQLTGAAASGRAVQTAPVTMNDRSAYAQITGVDSQAGEVYSFQVVQGRFLTPQDQRFGLPSVVLDQNLCDALELTPQSAIGKQLIIGHTYYTIIGVAHPQATQVQGPWAGCAYVPLACFEENFGAGVDEITVNLLPDVQTHELTQAVLAALPASGTYQVVTLEDEIAAARSIIHIFVMVLACVACICMIVGGIGVMNILLVSVRERRREIGLLKALGATRRQICRLFLCEAALYALAGALSGLGAGLGMIAFTGRLIGLAAQLQLSALLPVLAGTGVVGILFGVFPAVKAAGLTPVKALNAP